MTNPLETIPKINPNPETFDPLRCGFSLEEYCPKCGEPDFSPSVEAYEATGQVMCAHCAEDIFESLTQKKEAQHEKDMA